MAEAVYEYVAERRTSAGLSDAQLEVVSDGVDYAHADYEESASLMEGLFVIYVVSFIGLGIFLLVAGSKKQPIQPPQTTTGSSAPDRV